MASFYKCKYDSDGENKLKTILNLGSQSDDFIFYTCYTGDFECLIEKTSDNLSLKLQATNVNHVTNHRLILNCRFQSLPLDSLCSHILA